MLTIKTIPINFVWEGLTTRGCVITMSIKQIYKLAPPFRRPDSDIDMVGDSDMICREEDMTTFNIISVNHKLLQIGSALLLPAPCKDLPHPLAIQVDIAQVNTFQSVECSCQDGATQSPQVVV